MSMRSDDQMDETASRSGLENESSNQYSASTNVQTIKCPVKLVEFDVRSFSDQEQSSTKLL
jgi:hypothetical protein